MEKIRKLVVAIIPDGNRRYAEKKNISYREAYSLSANSIEKLFHWAKNRDIKSLIIWALSTDNFKKRSLAERRILFDIFVKKAEKYLKKKLEGVNVYFIGQIYKLPNNVKNAVRRLEEEYNNVIKPLKIYILLNYSGEVELMSAFNNRKNKTKSLRDSLWLKEDIDLIIRTGGERRLSNFAIYQSRYAELYFIDKLFPEVTVKDLDKALEHFYKVERRFGR